MVGLTAKEVGTNPPMPRQDIVISIGLTSFSYLFLIIVPYRMYQYILKIHEINARYINQTNALLVLVLGLAQLV